MMTRRRRRGQAAALRFLIAGPILWCLGVACPGQEPEAVNPFGPAAERPDQKRDDAVPGVVELSDGSLHPGQVYLTREARLKILDEAQKKHREVPLRVIDRIDCTVLKEWVEEEWRFKENASDEKYFTGKTYPAREYSHTIRLKNGQSIKGNLSALVYVRAEGAEKADRYILHERDKGAVGTDLKSLLYVRSVRLGPRALEEAKRKAGGAGPAASGRKPVPGRSAVGAGRGH